MAVATAFLTEDQFTCSICLDVFTNPVSTPCGHSFCLACISSYWDGSSKSCLCPLCKESFRRRPELHINRTLKEITEQFKLMAEPGGGVDADAGSPRRRSTAVGEDSAGEDSVHRSNVHPHRCSRPGEMPGSVLAEMKMRLQGARSLEHRDDSHLSHTHLDHPLPYSPPRRYTLSGPADSTPNVPLCPNHLRGLEFFCRNDQTCVCASCLETAEHQGHSTIPAKREWQIKKSQIGIKEVELRDLIKERQQKVEEIQQTLQDIQACAASETEGSVQAFSMLVSSVERCQAEVLEVIEMARRSAEHRAQGLVAELETEIAELKKRTTTLSQLAQTNDYILFLKTYPVISSAPLAKDWSEARLTSERTSGAVLWTVTQMMERFEEDLRRLPQICQRSPVEKTVYRSNPELKRVQEYAEDITLDPNTAHPRLIISVDGKQVCCGDRHQQVEETPERFNRVVCVLARQSFSSGRHYWEVEVGGKTDWDLGIVSRSINRKGKITVSPAHGYWFLSLRDQTDYAFRTDPSTALTLGFRPSRIGVFVDCDKGQVSFYDVATKALIFTFTDSFRDTIHPFFSPCTNKSGRNEAPLIIYPVAIRE